MARARRWTCTTINDDGSISYYLFHGDTRRTAYLKITMQGSIKAEIGLQHEGGGDLVELKPELDSKLQADVTELVSCKDSGSERASKLWATLYHYWKSFKK